MKKALSKKDMIEEMVSSRYQSPKKQQERVVQEEVLPNQTQFQLERVFEEAAHREEKYLATISQQENRMQLQAQKYLESLREIKKEFTAFLNLKGGKGQSKWKTLAEQQRIVTKNEIIRLNSNEFSEKTRGEYEKAEGGRVEPQLHCVITCYYYTPFLSDYIRQTVPEELILTLRSLYPNSEQNKEIRIVKEEDEVDNINCLIHRVPFQITTETSEAIRFQFVVPCQQQAICYYRRRELEMELVNRKGMFSYATAKLNLNSLLFYENQPTEWQLKPLSFYSTLQGRKVGEMSVKFGNRLQLADRNEHYKIQSTTPIQMNKLKGLVNYNDDESRLIQRISKFKTTNNSLLMGIGSSPTQAKAERFFETENEKIVLMHRHKKQLQTIQQYKNSHKEELMDRIFNDAIDRYYLTDCYIGSPKYVVFNFINHEREHCKIHLKTEIKLKNAQEKQVTPAQLSIEQCVAVSALTAGQINMLVKEDLIHLPSDSYYDYEMDEDQSLWTISGMGHALVLRVICLPPSISLLSETNLQGSYELKLTLVNEYDQEVETYHTKIRLRQPAPEHSVHIHGYLGTISQLQLCFEEGIAKKVISNLPGLAYRWNEKSSILFLKVEHKGIGEKSYFLMVNDNNHLFQLGCYQLTIFTYAPLTPSLSLSVGEVRKLALEFMLDEAALTQKEVQTGLKPSSAQKDQARVLFTCSKPEHCMVRCQGQSELICKINKVYQVDIRLQSFDSSLNPQRILVHAQDLTSNKILKRWLLQIQKQEETEYKQVLKLICEQGKPLKYKFELVNDVSRDRSFRLYSSNLSILSVTESAIPLIDNQKVVIDLEFTVKQELSNEDLLHSINVILTVSDGVSFLNYLFELSVRTH